MAPVERSEGHRSGWRWPRERSKQRAMHRVDRACAVLEPLVRRSPPGHVGHEMGTENPGRRVTERDGNLVGSKKSQVKRPL